MRVALYTSRYGIRDGRRSSYLRAAGNVSGTHKSQQESEQERGSGSPGSDRERDNVVSILCLLMIDGEPLRSNALEITHTSTAQPLYYTTFAACWLEPSSKREVFAGDRVGPRTARIGRRGRVAISNPRRNCIRAPLVCRDYGQSQSQQQQQQQSTWSWPHQSRAMYHCIQAPAI